MKLQVLTYQGKETGREIELPSGVFKSDPNDHAIYLDVKQHMANKRQGTHMAKDRSLITGSTRKLKRQKGSGTARAGSIKSPVFRGGGRVFGPQPRDYSFKLNKKLKVVARRSALSYKMLDKCISIIEDFDFEAPRTKSYIDMLGALSLTEKKTLLVLTESKKNIYLSARNIPNARVILADQLNTYEVLHADNLLISEASVEIISKILN